MNEKIQLYKYKFIVTNDHPKCSCTSYWTWVYNLYIHNIVKPICIIWNWICSRNYWSTTKFYRSEYYLSHRSPLSTVGKLYNWDTRSNATINKVHEYIMALEPTFLHHLPSNYYLYWYTSEIRLAIMYFHYNLISKLCNNIMNRGQ